MQLAIEPEVSSSEGKPTQPGDRTSTLQKWYHSCEAAVLLEYSLTEFRDDAGDVEHLEYEDMRFRDPLSLSGRRTCDVA